MNKDNTSNGIVRITKDSDIPEFLQKDMIVVDNTIYLLQSGKNTFPIGTSFQYTKVGKEYEFHEIS